MVGCVVSVVCGNDQDKIIISGYIWADYPPPPEFMAYYRIWAAGGWYASYWNAFLFQNVS